MIKVNLINIDREILIEKVCDFLKISKPNLHSETNKEIIKELCVARLCKSVGINCKYNYKSEFFEFFSNIVGEALADKLNLNIRVAIDELRLIKYERKNLVQEARRFLDNDNIDEAFLDAFKLVNDFKYLIIKLRHYFE